MTNRLPMYIGSLAEFIEYHKEGSIRVLATMGTSRSPFLPDVPTLKESGFDIEDRHGSHCGRPQAHPRM